MSKKIQKHCLIEDVLQGLFLVRRLRERPQKHLPPDVEQLPRSVVANPKEAHVLPHPTGDRHMTHDHDGAEGLRDEVGVADDRSLAGEGGGGRRARRHREEAREEAGPVVEVQVPDEVAHGVGMGHLELVRREFDLVAALLGRRDTRRIQRGHREAVRREYDVVHRHKGVCPGPVHGGAVDCEEAVWCGRGDVSDSQVEVSGKVRYALEVNALDALRDPPQAKYLVSEKFEGR